MRFSNILFCCSNTFERELTQSDLEPSNPVSKVIRHVIMIIVYINLYDLCQLILQLIVARASCVWTFPICELFLWFPTFYKKFCFVVQKHLKRNPNRRILRPPNPVSEFICNVRINVTYVNLCHLCKSMSQLTVAQALASLYRSLEQRTPGNRL